jgi:hypothetical protein
MKLNKEALTYFWNEFGDAGKHKMHCIGDFELLFVCIFGKMFKLLGMPYDVEDQEVSILSSIVDQSYSIMKKGAALSNNIVFMVSKGVFLTSCLCISSTGMWSKRKKNKRKCKQWNNKHWSQIQNLNWIQKKIQKN